MIIKETWCESMDWMHLSMNKVQWQAVVNTEIKLWISKIALNF